MPPIVQNTNTVVVVTLGKSDFQTWSNSGRNLFAWTYELWNAPLTQWKKDQEIGHKNIMPVLEQTKLSDGAISFRPERAGSSWGESWNNPTDKNTFSSTITYNPKIK